MKNTSYVAYGMLAVLILVVPACDWLKRIETVSQEPSVRIIDVNTVEIYNDAHIPGATHYELDELEDASNDWNKKTTLIVYCSDYKCMASHIAAKKFNELGFDDVAVYAGGIGEWYKLSKENKEMYPLVGEAKQAFLEMEVEKFDSKEEDGKVISAQEVAQRLKEMQKEKLAA